MAKPREGYHDLFAQIPENLWQALNAEAEAEDRTVTAQLIRMLRERYGDGGATSPPPKTPAKKRPQKEA